LEAPLPLHLTLKKASELQKGEYIKMIHRMKPCHLSSFLEKMDAWWADFENKRDEYLFFIAKKDDIQTIGFVKEEIANEYDRIVT
jgi:hypothetical protein